VTTGSIDLVPQEIVELLNEYKEIVAKDIHDGLPLIRSISHCMDLIPGASLSNKVPYRLTPIENEELNRQVHELLEKGLIKENLIPCVVSIVLAPKKNGEWRICTDSKVIYKIIVIYKFPMPRMDCLSGANHLTKIDLKSGYHQIRIREGDEWKTTFKKKDGLYDLVLV